MAHLYIGWDLITGVSITDVAIDIRPSKQMTVYRTVRVLKLMNIFISSCLVTFVCTFICLGLAYNSSLCIAEPFCNYS